MVRRQFPEADEVRCVDALGTQAVEPCDERRQGFDLRMIQEQAVEHQNIAEQLEDRADVGA